MALEYLNKFNNLPPKIKDKISTPEIVQEINAIGKRYQINLATTVMKVMVKEIAIRNLANYFINNFGFDQARAQHLENELKDKVFADVINYLYRKDSLPTLDQGGVPLTASEDDYWDNKIEYIVERSGLTLSSEMLQKRLNNILLTYLKHVRNKLNTKDALTKPLELGGLGLDELSANNLLLLADDKIREGETLEIRPPARMPVPEDSKGFTREADYNLERALAQKQGQINKQTKSIAPPPPAIRPAVQSNIQSAVVKTPAQTVSSQSVVAQPVVKKPVAKPAQPLAQSKSVEPPQPINNIQKTESGKIKMDDIKATPKVFTPVDELRYMTLKNFRNLDSDPFQAIVKIKDKLKVLKSDDYSKMVAGIKAWKISPVNKLYLNVYNQGLQQGKSAQDILQQNKSDQNSLTEQEFDAIIKLNQELKF